MNTTELSALLASKENDFFRGQTDPNMPNYIYDQQINAAKKIVYNLGCNNLRTNHVVLVAPMQSGKTATCISVVNIINKLRLHINMHIKNFLFITGMNDCGLKDQTSQRICNQVLGIDESEIVASGCAATYKSKYFILKNSDLLSFEGSLDNSLIFIDESHYGANASNVLTKFFTKHNIDWKNTINLARRNIYIVSISATPFSELVSDTMCAKKIIQLQTNQDYCGVSDFLNEDVVFDADKDDIQDNGPIFDYILDAKYRMEDNKESGIIFIRTRQFDVIKNSPVVQDNFDVFEMDSNGSRIQYDALKQIMDEVVANQSTAKPLIVLIKGAFRAGITISPAHKDYIYMVYDYSCNADTTAQAMLGRMCGYRANKEKISKTFFYVNKQFVNMYSDWSKDFTNRDLIPSSRTKWTWVGNDYDGHDVEFGSKSCGNFSVVLSDAEAVQVHKLKGMRPKQYAATKSIIDKILANHNQSVPYDYIGEIHVNGKNNYAQSSQTKRFDSFSKESLVFQFRPEKISQFVSDTGRKILTKDDLGKKSISIVLDAVINGDKISGNKRLLVYYVEVGQKCRAFVRKGQYQLHKDTNLLVK